MNITSQRIALLLILTFMTLLLLGCESNAAINQAEEFSPTPGQAMLMPGNATPAPTLIPPPNPAYAIAQATLDSGQSQLLDLSRQATLVSQNMTQAANAAIQSTQDYNQRQKVDLAFQATEVSLNITRAAATQNYLTQNTLTAGQATATAQSSAATATQSAFLMNVTQTAQVEGTLAAYLLTATASAHEQNVTETAQAVVILNAQAAKTLQSMATMTAYPMTATPLAVTKAAVLMQEYDREQQTFLNQFIIPLAPVIATLDLLLFVLVIIFAYRRYILRSRPLSSARVINNPRPLNTIDGVAIDYDPRTLRMIPFELMSANPPGAPDDQPVQVEIVDAAEPPVDHWIAEVERQLASEGGPLL